MAARDRYTIECKCPKCEKGGIVHLSEDDHPYMRDPGLWIDELPPGFSTPDSSPIYHVKALATCDACQHTFHLFPRWAEQIKEAVKGIRR